MDGHVRHLAFLPHDVRLDLVRHAAATGTTTVYLSVTYASGIPGAPRALAITVDYASSLTLKNGLMAYYESDEGTGTTTADATWDD